MNIPDDQVLKCPHCGQYLAWMIGDVGLNIICTACHRTWYSKEHIDVMLRFLPETPAETARLQELAEELYPDIYKNKKT